MSEEQRIDGVLACYSFGCISGSKRDAVITKEVTDAKHAGSDAGTWSNKLFPPKACGKRTTFTELRKHLGQMRQWTYSNTYTFEESHWRILPRKRIESFKQHVEIDGKQRAHELLEAFIADLPNLIDLARIGRGEAFKESDYPTVSEIRETFFYDVDYRPVPTGAGLDPVLMQEAIEKLNALHSRRLKEANETLVARFLAPFATLAEQLKDPTGRKIKPILETINEFMEILPSMDLSGNEELLGLATQVGATFTGLSPEMIKTDEDLRARLGATAEGVIAALGGFKRQFA